MIVRIGDDEFIFPEGTTRAEAQLVIDDAIAVLCEEQYAAGHPRPTRDERGHFPGCYTQSCRATRCRAQVVR